MVPGWTHANYTPCKSILCSQDTLTLHHGTVPKWIPDMHTVPLVWVFRDTLTILRQYMHTVPPCHSIPKSQDTLDSTRMSTCTLHPFVRGSWDPRSEHTRTVHGITVQLSPPLARGTRRDHWNHVQTWTKYSIYIASFPGLPRFLFFGLRSV